MSLGHWTCLFRKALWQNTAGQTGGPRLLPMDSWRQPPRSLLVSLPTQTALPRSQLLSCPKENPHTCTHNGLLPITQQTTGTSLYHSTATVTQQHAQMIMWTQALVEQGSLRLHHSCLNLMCEQPWPSVLHT